jgi:hypothetical protein
VTRTALRGAARAWSWLLVAWLASAMSGCVATIPDDRFACASDDECPPAFACREGFCRRDVADDVGLDATRLDGAGLDAAGLDASASDASLDAAGDAGTYDAFGIDASMLDARDASIDEPPIDAAPIDAPLAADARIDANADAFCMRRTCAAAGAQCGLLDDLCGGMRNCGDCMIAGQTCVANHCVP